MNADLQELYVDYQCFTKKKDINLATGGAYFVSFSADKLVLCLLAYAMPNSCLAEAVVRESTCSKVTR